MLDTSSARAAVVEIPPSLDKLKNKKKVMAVYRELATTSYSELQHSSLSAGGLVHGAQPDRWLGTRSLDMHHACMVHDGWLQPIAPPSYVLAVRPTGVIHPGNANV
jgi:hypothetical protein